MARHIYRCSRCRSQNRFRRAVGDYVIPRRCKSCGHTHFYVDKQAVCQAACKCSGYHYTHRLGSRCCEHNPRSEYWQRLRAGEHGDALTALWQELTIAMVDSHSKPTKGECPF